MTEPTPTFDRVILDYGHGGMVKDKYQTRGKQYHFTDEPEMSVYEGVINRNIAVALAAMLLDTGIVVLDAVARKPIIKPDFPVEQRDTSLRERIRFVNAFPARGTLLLSIHGNAVGMSSTGPSQRARGISIYTSKGQTLSDPVATSIYDAFADSPDVKTTKRVPLRRGDWSDGDPDKEADFYVLRNSRCAAVLGETGFFTNRKDANFMCSDKGAAAFAAAYFAGLLPWLKVRGSAAGECG